MQIQNNYTSYMGGENSSRNHYHHVTDCLHGEAEKKPKAAAAAQLSSLGKDKAGEGSDSPNIRMSLYPAAKAESRDAKGAGWAKRFWDYLGQEENGQTESIRQLFSVRHISARGSSAAAAAFSNGFPAYIATRWTAVRQSIRTHKAALLKKFSRGREAFSALADGRMPWGKRHRQHTGERKKGAVTTRRGAVEVIIQHSGRNHLMDSYSKKGEYCQLNENLSAPGPLSKYNR